MSRDLLDEQGRTPAECEENIRAQLAALVARHKDWVARGRPRTIRQA